MGKEDHHAAYVINACYELEYHIVLTEALGVDSLQSSCRISLRWMLRRHPAVPERDSVRQRPRRPWFSLHPVPEPGLPLGLHGGRHAELRVRHVDLHCDTRRSFTGIHDDAGDSSFSS